MTTKIPMKNWITKSEIMDMFFISSTTFTNRAAQGRWGAPIGDVPNSSGSGRNLIAYSMEHVLEVYRRELPYIASRATARGVSAEEFDEAIKSRSGLLEPPAQPRIVWMALVDGVAKIMTVPEYTDDSPYYDGLPI